MADATFQTLKTLFAHVPELDEFTIQQATELAEWFTAHTGKKNPTPNDFIRDIYETYDQQVKSHKRSKSTQVWGP